MLQYIAPASLPVATICAIYRARALRTLREELSSQCAARWLLIIFIFFRDLSKLPEMSCGPKKYMGLDLCMLHHHKVKNLKSLLWCRVAR